MTDTGIKGAATAAPAGRRFLGVPEFYLPPFGVDHCDICGEMAEQLARIVLEPSRRIEVETAVGKKLGWRAARVAHVCERHPAHLTRGGPVATPNTVMAPGTSRLRPQAKALFDDTSLKRGSRR